MPSGPARKTASFSMTRAANDSGRFNSAKRPIQVACAVKYLMGIANARVAKGDDMLQSQQIAFLLAIVVVSDIWTIQDSRAYAGTTKRIRYDQGPGSLPY